ncbi:MAG: histidine kinase N-terminal 7TM domain-containing protein [Pseudohongiellaceae bacterium]
MEQMQILGLVALLAGMAKTAILALSKTENKLTSVFALVCISMILQNTFEFLVSLTYNTNSELATFFMHCEMLSIIFLVFCLLLFSLTVTGQKHIKPIAILFGLWALICASLLVTGQLVLGYQQTGYTVISIPAPYYAVINSYAFAAFHAMLLFLIHSSLTSHGEARKRSRQVLVALIPIWLLILVVQLARLVGINSSTAVFMPLATTFFVGMMVMYQSGGIVIFKIKWTVIWKLATRMRDVKLSEWVGLVEELLVKESMRLSGNNQSEAAKLIKSNQTTVGRKFKKYGSDGREPS